MGRKSKVETSPHYHQILDKLNSGVSCQKISDWLAEEYDEKISRIAINNYKNKLNDEIEEQVKTIRKEKVNSQVQAYDYIDGKVRCLVVCEELMDEVKGLYESINQSDLKTNEKIELIKAIKDYGKMRLDFAKTQDINVDVSGDIGLNGFFEGKERILERINERKKKD